MQARALARVVPKLGPMLLAGSMLAGCDSLPKFPPACPSLALLRDAADITRFAPGGSDVRALVLDARIVAAPANCAYDSPTRVRATLRVAFAVERGPAATGRAIDLPYFVAVTDAGRIRDEADYRLIGAFPPNTDRTALTGQEVTLLFPVTKEKSAAAYQIYVGFRLTPEELAVNRGRGPR